ncbi:hypothetical protein CTheo_7193 [Ceratobasidium theobromae]|uniref:Ricin B lectin domain-containing protein n=1 Tax=Ceratobasidium theobromae TaxID=1582974 RepID=A0A5N5QC74_9AGAM|nr:hypothetical protein CTheo_7193 [Ceratobasidium theobromae]
MANIMPRAPHLIRSVDSEDKWAGTGPVPMIFPPPAAPLRVIDGSFKNKFVFEPLGDDNSKFYIKELEFDYYVGKVDELDGKKDVVKLVQKLPGGPDKPPGAVEWILVPDGPGVYRIQYPGPGNLSWTAPITVGPEAHPVIVLEPEGSQGQLWEIVPILRD